MDKKILVLVLSIAMLSGSLFGCNKWSETEKAYETEASKSMFIEVESATHWRVVYDKETKVMYAVSSDYGSGTGVFTLLVDENGNPKLWDGD